MTYCKRTSLLVALVILTAIGSAYGLEVKIYADPAAAEAQIFDNGPGIVPLYVIATQYFGLTGVQFSAPLPSCFTGAVWVGDTHVFPLHVGNSQAGVAIGWDECLQAPVHVLTINVLAQGLTETCCPYPVLPDPMVISGQVEGSDCASNVVYGVGLSSYVFDEAPGPPLIGGPNPPNGATNQPLDTDIHWTVTSQRCGCPLMTNRVYFGTDPNPPIDPHFMSESTTFDPGPLQPHTTYYWKVLSFYCCPCDSDESATGPVWSFTTEGGVPAVPTTWGRIKSLFES